jgi:hypothetical protein
VVQHFTAALLCSPIPENGQILLKLMHIDVLGGSSRDPLKLNPISIGM